MPELRQAQTLWLRRRWSKMKEERKARERAALRKALGEMRQVQRPAPRRRQSEEDAMSEGGASASQGPARPRPRGTVAWECWEATYTVRESEAAGVGESGRGARARWMVFPQAEGTVALASWPAMPGLMMTGEE